MTRRADDDARQLAAALRASGEDAPPTDECPAADRIWAAARRELPLEDRLRVIDHTTECPSCAEAWRLAVALGSDVEAAEVPQSDRKWFRRPATWLWPAAAVLALAVASALLLRSRPADVEPTVRDPGAESIQSAVPPGAALPRDDFTLRWVAGAAGERYDLTVTTSELDVVVVTRGLERPEYRVSPERLANLPRGARLLWRVVARAPDGGTRASPTFEVRVQ